MISFKNFLINTRLRFAISERRIWKRSNKQEEKDTVWQKNDITKMRESKIAHYVWKKRVIYKYKHSLYI